MSLRSKVILNKEGLGLNNISIDDVVLENVIPVQANCSTKIYSWQRVPGTDRQVLKLNETTKLKKPQQIKIKLEDVNRREWSILDTKTVNLFKTNRKLMKQQSTQADASDTIVKRDLLIK